jgi:hypothetical protein
MRRNQAASLEDAKKERMHQCQRIKWSRLRSEQKMNKNHSWTLLQVENIGRLVSGRGDHLGVKGPKLIG